MVFTEKPTAKLQAQITGTTSTVTLDGITPSNTLTPENAKAQADKILDIVGKACETTGMKQIIVREATAGE